MQRKRGTGTTGLNLLAPTFFPSTMMHTWTCMYIRMLGSFVLFFTVVALSVSPATWWISKNKKRRRRGWVLTIRRRDQATHTLMSQSCFLMCLCTAGHINTSTADASILSNPKSQEKVSFLGFAMEMMKQGMSEQRTSSPLSPKHLSSSALLCSCSTWLTADLCHPRSLWNCVFTFNSFHN